MQAVLLDNLTRLPQFFMAFRQFSMQPGKETCLSPRLWIHRLFGLDEDTLSRDLGLGRGSSVSFLIMR